MEQIPDFWRTEVWHPLSVHFPIALLIIATIFKLISLRFKRETWILGGTVLLVLGTIGAWLAVYTGNLADGIVSRQICDPTILKDHENAAYVVAWLFSAATLIDILSRTKIHFFKSYLLKIITVLVMLTGTGFLIYVGHLGATLVYQQGAGTYQPSPDCSEFVD